MGIFIQYSNCLMLCTKQMMSNAALKTTVPFISKKPYSRRIETFILESDLIINHKLKNFETMEDTDWADVRKSLIDKYKLTDTTVDSKVWDLASYYKRYDEGINYFKFLKRNNYNPNMHIMSQYLKYYFIRSKPITAEEDDEICYIYDTIIKQHPLLDAITCTNCLLGLSLTKRWKDTIKLLDMIKLSTNLGVLAPSAVISAAFRNDEPELGWKMMNEQVEHESFSHFVYLEYLNYCKRHFQCEELIEEVKKMFNFWRIHWIYPTEHVIVEYVDLMNTLGYNGHTASIERGYCTHCKLQLGETTLSKTDFKILSASVLKTLIVGKNVYYSSSPQELKRYMIFVQTMKPYDVVIDGLNVAYGARAKVICNKHTINPGSLLNIIDVVNYFKKQNKRILVIGRVHIQWWSQEQMKIIKNNADLFLTKNLSNDDPYLLHLTLLSGPDTFFVSRDLMRQHKNKLNPSLQPLFKRWQMSRQYLFGSNNGKIKLIPPLFFEPNAQEDTGGWHIPYETSASLNLPNVYTAPEKWICLRKIKKSDINKSFLKT